MEGIIFNFQRLSHKLASGVTKAMVSKELAHIETSSASVSHTGASQIASTSLMLLHNIPILWNLCHHADPSQQKVLVTA